MVRDRHQLVGHSHDAISGTREINQSGQPGSAFPRMMEDVGAAQKRERQRFEWTSEGDEVAISQNVQCHAP